MKHLLRFFRALFSPSPAHYPTSRKPYLIAEHIRAATPRSR